MVDATQQLIFVFIIIVQTTPFLFAGIYAAFGVADGCVTGADGPLDILYFSYATFTTVGYGDLAPVGPCRLVSATQGLAGYLLLGALGAALYAAVQDKY